MKTRGALSSARANDYAPADCHQTSSAMYASLAQFKPCDLPALLSSLQSIAPLLDTLSDVVFFIKDCQARYAFVNQTLARRCGVKHSSELLGHTAEMVFPRRFGPLYTEQDRRVLASGRELADQLELHLYYANQPIWCLTHKLALRDTQNRIVGLAGNPEICNCRSPATRPFRNWRQWMNIFVHTFPDRSAWLN